MTPQFRGYWGPGEPPAFVGLLVIGRDAELTPEARQRIAWRSTKLKINSYPILCMTYDEMVSRLSNKLDLHAEQPTAPS